MDAVALAMPEQGFPKSQKRGTNQDIKSYEAL